MATTKKVSSEKNPRLTKQYYSNIPRRFVYGPLALFAVVAVGLFLCIPHYKPLHVASNDEIDYAHKTIIGQYFLASTTCQHDNVDKSTRIKTFNTYFKVNKYGNRAVLRSCNDNDILLAKADDGSNYWFKTDVNLNLSLRANPKWQKLCLIDDITTADTVVRPENSAIDATNYKLCTGLTKQSYVEVHFHF